MCIRDRNIEEQVLLLANLCKDWEQAALAAEESDTRVCLLRFGIVLGREGGILKQIALSYQLGLGTYIGNGRQCIPWIHLEDVVHVVSLCLNDATITGSINCTAPHPVNAKTFSRTLKTITQAKLNVGIPSFLLRLMFGEGVAVLTNSQNALPEKLIRNGYDFKYPRLNEALHEEFDDKNIVIKEIKFGRDRSACAIEFPDLATQGQYELRTMIKLNSQPKTAFSFFSSPLKQLLIQGYLQIAFLLP